MSLLEDKLDLILDEKRNVVLPENIKSGIEILGVQGNVIPLSGQTKTVTPTTSSQTIVPDTGYNGITEVTVNAVTNSIDNNIQSSNIKNGVSILGVQGNYEGEPINLQNKTVSITTNGQTSVSADNNYDGLDTVTINTNVQPTLQSKSVTITDNGTQTVSMDSGYYGLNSVEITTNVSGGTPANIETITELNQTIKTLLDNFNTYAYNIQSTYNVLTNDNVTLYTPNINYKYYLIQLRSSGLYRVAWVSSPRKINTNANNTSGNIYPFKTKNYSPSRSDIFNIEFSYYLDDVEKDYVYVSGEYNSIETCIEKMKNNELTYTQMNNYLAYVPTTSAKVPIANIGIYYFEEGSSSVLNDHFMMPTKISANETFVQIS